jgi:lysine decarboxylase
MGLSDHRRVVATLSTADTATSIEMLVEAITAWRAQLKDPTPPHIALPEPADLQLETVMLPRDAFFGPVEVVAAEYAPGRIVAEHLTPYPPGIPVTVPGELLNAAVIDYLATGIAEGMNIPDAADPELNTIRVVAQK